MKKLIALLAVALPLMGQAQPPEGQDWWACQSVENAGLVYRSGKLESTYFSDEHKFILVADGNSLKKGSLPDLLEMGVECRSNFFEAVVCSDELGGSLIFSPVTGQGAISTIFGGVMVGDKKDTLHVTPFECAKG